jgi:hypothetical protein
MGFLIDRESDPGRYGNPGKRPPFRS